jgi:hypothetical protein
MNRIQEAIAKVTGVDTELYELSSALEDVTGENRMLARQIEDLDYLNLFDIGRITEVIPSGDRAEYIKRLRRLRQENPLAKQAAKLTLRFTLGKGIQWVVLSEEPEELMDPETEPEDPVDEPETDQIPAPGGNLVPMRRKATPANEEVEDQAKITMEDFWYDPDNLLALTSRAGMMEWLDAVYTDGEFFFVCVIGTAAPWLKLTEVPLEEISQTIYHPDNRKRPIFYVRNYVDVVFNATSGMYEIKGEPKTVFYPDYRVTDEELPSLYSKCKIPAGKRAPKEQKIRHSYINPLKTKSGVRGISELYASRQWFRVFREFMENRAAINDAATSIAFKRKIKAGPTGVAQFKGKLGGLEVGDVEGSEIRKLTRPVPAAVYDSNPAVDLDWMKTDTGALNAKEDARMLLMAAGAGVGTNIHYFGEGGDANLATAQAMELPMVKSYEDWQQWVEDELREFVSYAFKLAFGEDNWRDNYERVAFLFPPIISQDVVKYMTAWSQFVQNVAPDNQTVKMQAVRGALSVMNVSNIDELMETIEEEEARNKAKRNADAAALKAQFNNNLPVTADGKNSPIARDGSANALPPDEQRMVSGKPQPQRIGVGGRIASRD